MPSQRDFTASRTIIVALSEGMNSDGTLMPNTIEVVKRAVGLLRMGVARKAILSSGIGYKFVKSMPKAEGQAMKDEAVAMGATRSSIVVESRSIDTPTNAYFTKLIVKKRFNGVKRIALVASRSHMARSAYLFRMLFGRGYSIVKYPSSDTLGSRELRLAAKCEKMSRRLTDDFLREYGFNPGDDRLFGRILREKYLFYNKRARLTAAQRMMLDRLVKLRKSYIKP